MLVSLIIIAFLLLMSAFFSGSETALTAASRPLMHQLEQKGNQRARAVNRLRQKKERLIGAILFGNNLVNIMASALATSIFIARYGEAGIAYATISMTLLVLIFAEIMPKTYALKRANRTSLAIAPIVKALVLVLSPITVTLNFIINATFKIFGIDFKADKTFASAEEELRGAIELHNGEDHAVQHERVMLRSILDLDDVQVGEIMVHRKNVVMINANQPIDTIVAEVLASPYTRIPIWRDQPDNIVGVLHAKALLKAVRERGKKHTSLDIITLATKPWFIPESTKLLNQLNAFRQRRQHFALMVDEYGSLMGIVTLEDILEEIVGEISDELDISTTGIHAQADGSYIVDGGVTIRDLNRQLNWDLPDEEAATVAGLILHESRRIPDTGQAFIFHNFRFEILQRMRHQITSLRIIAPQNAAKEKTNNKP